MWRIKKIVWTTQWYNIRCSNHHRVSLALVLHAQRLLFRDSKYATIREHCARRHYLQIFRFVCIWSICSFRPFPPPLSSKDPPCRSFRLAFHSFRLDHLTPANPNAVPGIISMFLFPLHSQMPPSHQLAPLLYSFASY